MLAVTTCSHDVVHGSWPVDRITTSATCGVPNPVTSMVRRSCRARHVRHGLVRSIAWHPQADPRQRRVVRRRRQRGRPPRHRAAEHQRRRRPPTGSHRARRRRGIEELSTATRLACVGVPVVVAHADAEVQPLGVDGPGVSDPAVGVGLAPTTRPASVTMAATVEHRGAKHGRGLTAPVPIDCTPPSSARGVSQTRELVTVGAVSDSPTPAAGRRRRRAWPPGMAPALEGVQRDGLDDFPEGTSSTRRAPRAP